MKFTELISESTFMKRRVGDDSVEYDFHWDQDKLGFIATRNGTEVGFFKAKSLFDRSGAQDQAKALLIAIMKKDHQVEADRKAGEYEQKPLSDIEKKWWLLHKRMSKFPVTPPFTDAELQQYERWGCLELYEIQY